MSARLGAPAGAPAARSAQPLFDLAFNPEDIKARLNAVPVFAVVNNKNEFVLVAGEVRWGGVEVAELKTCTRLAVHGEPVAHACVLPPCPLLYCYTVQEDADKQLGLFFFSEAEAEAMLKTVGG